MQSEAARTKYASTRSSVPHIGAWTLLLAIAASPAAVQAQVHIEDLRVGFGIPTSANEGNYKIGSWTPARVRIRAEKEGFAGRLELSTADSDDVETVFRRDVNLAPNESIDVMTYVKPGKELPEFHVRLVNAAGKLQARAVYDSSAGRGWDGASQAVTLIVAVGHPAGLDVDLIAKRPGYPREQFRIGQLETTRELSSRWYGYEAVNHLILCLDDPVQIENMDVAARAAMETWVRNGGHLVVSVGTSWERVQSVLGRLLPADIDRTETVQQLTELEKFAGASAPPLRIRGDLSLPHLTNVRGHVVLGTNELPLAVRAPLGLGSITLVALELNHEPFSSWDGRTDFWINLLGLRKRPGQDNSPQGAWGVRALTDISSYLRLQLEHFEGVSLVPFQWVAFFIFIYILLIGPVDYLLVKKVLKRMELTWITFPTIVIGVSLAAYFTAYWLKGDELRINKIDVVDVDQASGDLRGTSWFTLFSPQIKNYTVRLQPDLAVAPIPNPQMSSPPVIVSWLGLAEDAIGGMSRQGGVGLFRRGYAFGSDAQTMVDVPIQVWSMKGFSGRWHGRAGPTVDANLQSLDTNRAVKGTITNRLPMALDDCTLVFNRKVYPLGTLPPDGSVVVESRTTQDLSGHLSRRAAPFANQSRVGAGVSDSGRFNPTDLIFSMMFHGRLPEGGQVAANNYFGDLDLSEHLDYERAILVGRVAKGGCQLFLNDAEVTENLTSATYLRVILPVTPGPSEPVLFTPPSPF
jgi:hypothetical protein